MKITELTAIKQQETKTGGVRDVVGFVDCRCGQVSTVLRGKAKLYEVCPDCGTKLANGNANTQYLIKNMRVSETQGAALVITTIIKQDVDNVDIVIKPVIKDEPKKQSFIMRVFEFELFTL